MLTSKTETIEGALLPVDGTASNRVKSPVFDVSNLTKYQRDYIAKWVQILKDTEGMARTELEYYIKISDEKISIENLYKMRKKYSEKGIEGIVPKWGHRKGGQKNPEIKEEQWNLFKPLYFKQGGPSVASVRLAVKKFFEPNNENYPSEAKFRRRIAAEYSREDIDYYRKGEKYWNDTYAFKINRDWSQVPVGDVWYSDHRQHDVLVVNKEGKHVRMWTTSWMDARTHKMLAYFIHEEAPNSNHILQSFAWAVQKYGLPKKIYIDNGKDYRAHDITDTSKRHKNSAVYLGGEQIKNAKAIMSIFDIRVIFSQPYNAGAKTIEFDHRMYANFDKFWRGYTGNNPANKPFALSIEKKKGLDSTEDFAKCFENWVENIYNNYERTGKILQGIPQEYADRKKLSPNQAWEILNGDEREIRMPTEESMALLYTRGKNTKIGAAGIKDKIAGTEIYYWHEKFMGIKGTQVYIRRDIRKWQNAYVYDIDTDKLLCVAGLQYGVSAVIDYDDDHAQEELQKRMKIKSEEKRRRNKRLKLDNVEVKDVLNKMSDNSKSEYLVEDKTAKQKITYIRTFKDEEKILIKQEKERQKELENYYSAAAENAGTIEQPKEYDWGKHNKYRNEFRKTGS